MHFHGFHGFFFLIIGIALVIVILRNKDLL